MSLILLLSACGVSDLGELPAAADLLLSTTNASEERLNASGAAAGPDDLPPALAPDPFRECDGGATWAGLFGQFDADADGVLDAEEEGAVQATYAEGTDPGAIGRLWMQWGMLLLVYDLDGSGVLEEGERATLLDHFTVRCAPLQTLLVDQFDADGDGVLSEAEEEAARAVLDAMAPVHHEGCEGGPPAGGPPEDAPTVGGVPVPPPLRDECDADGDGTLSGTEAEALRASMRERIRAGDPLMGPPPGAEPPHA